MALPATKQSLLDQLRHEHVQWEAIVADVGEQRVHIPGAMGEWTFHDAVAHLTTWWRREVARLAAAQRGERPPDHPSQDDGAVINQWIYLTNRDRPWPDVLRDAEAVWLHLQTLIQSTPDDLLLQPGRLDWLDGQALGPAILQDFVLHLHEEHEPLIREWLAQLDVPARPLSDFQESRRKPNTVLIRIRVAVVGGR